MTEHRPLAGLLLALLAIASGPAHAAEPAQTPSPATSRLETLASAEAASPTYRQLNVQRWVTSGGARVLFVEAHELPMFDLRVTFAAGSAQDGSAPGLALLTNAMLNEGVPGKDVDAIARGFEGLGADFGNGSYRDMAVLSLRSLVDERMREPALALFSQVAGQPTFPAASVTRMKNQLLASFEYQKQSPAHLANQAFMAGLYGDHPYAHASEGDAKSVQAITVQQMRAFHKRAYAAGNAVIALVGDLDRAQAEAIAEQVSHALPTGPALPAVQPARVNLATTTHIEFPSKQSHLLLGQLGIDRNDPDYAALSMGNQILGGGGFGTRLMTEVRERRGLAYGISSGFSPMQGRGPFSISLQTRAPVSQGTLELVRQVLRDYLRDGPTEAELAAAKKELAGSFPLSNASNASIVGQLASMGFYNLPPSYLEDFMAQSQQLTAAQVKSALNRHLDADKMLVVTVGPTVAQDPLPPPTDNPTEPPLGTPEH
ncbi:pitrilysin family protein [Pseudomonas sp. RIT-PI-S]|uniref:M16 family metallopeptidase n=1 Tax=Pseudomonas sp. RIT-PI-S TaxID=3035295 RepID=UPI0021D864EB|nr:pitrilysin family protein [Pseudomonas sp. RIT-PI-S]